MLDFSITLQRMSMNSNTNYPPSRTLLQFKYYWPNFKQLQWNKYCFSIPLRTTIFLKVQKHKAHNCKSLQLPSQPGDSLFLGPRQTVWSTPPLASVEEGLHFDSYLSAQCKYMFMSIKRLCNIFYILENMWIQTNVQYRLPIQLLVKYVSLHWLDWPWNKNAMKTINYNNSDVQW